MKSVSEKVSSDSGKEDLINGKQLPNSSNKLGFLSKFKVRKPDLNKWEQRIGMIFSITIKLGAILLVLTLISLIYRGLNNNHYTLTSFEVPASYEASGINGLVMANKLMDQTASLKRIINSVKEDESVENDGVKPEMQVAVLGLGLSVKSTIYYVKKALGKQNKSISGELVEMDDMLLLTLRITGKIPEQIKVPITKAGSLAAFEQIIEKGAINILKHTDPYRLCVYHTNEKEYTEAKEVLEFMRQDSYEEKEWLYHAWARLLYNQDKFESAIEKSRTTLELDPEFILAYYNIALCYDKLEQRDSAIHYYEQTVLREPDDPWRYHALAWAYAKNDEVELADQQYIKAVELAPDNPYFRNNWAYLHINYGEKERAKELFRENFALFPDEEVTWNGMGYIYQSEDRIEEGEAFLLTLLERDPLNYDILRNLAFVNMMKGKSEESQAYVNSMYKLPDADTAHIYTIMAGNLYRMDKLDSAVYYIDESLSLNAENPMALAVKAEISHFTGQKSAFYSYLEQAMKSGYRPLDMMLNQPPYSAYLEQERFQNLCKTYGLKLP